MKELIEIQSRLRCPKNQRNNFGGYNYRDCEDIMEAVKPLLKELDCTLTVSDEILLVGDRFYIKATTRLRNSNGEEVTTQAFAREEESKKGMDASQITGASSSYARKYALNGLFCIDDVKDSDSDRTNTGGDKKAQKVQSAATATAATTATAKGVTLAEKKMADLCAQVLGIDNKDELLQFYNEAPAAFRQKDTAFYEAVARRGQELNA